MGPLLCGNGGPFVRTLHLCCGNIRNIPFEISLIGLMIFSGLNFTTLKMMLIVVFLWLASPVSSHLIARLEVSSGTKADGRYEKDMILTEEGKLTKAEKNGKNGKNDKEE